MARSTNLLTLLFFSAASAQDYPPNVNRTTSWLIYQAIPSFTWTSFPAQTNFAFEWEAAPLVYSWRMNKQVSPWSSFFVNPVRRFTGSVELILSAQVYTSNPGASQFGWSGQLLGHIPLVEMGEHLTLNLGVARYVVNNASNTFYIVGASSLYGLLHYNVKYSPKADLWMSAIEVRFF